VNVAAHLARLKAAVYATYGLAEIPNWITTKTFLRGRRYSFKGHEFQLKVILDESQEVNVQKCSQIGMTEAQARWSLGVVRTFPNFSLIYTMPYSNDASLLCRTRVDPIISDSEDLKNATKSDLDNSEIKQIGNSFIYFRGTQGNTQALSIPADAIVSDEIDKSDSGILTTYTSRLRHSAWKLRRNFSTPTVDGYGIALKMETSRRFRNLVKCEFCNEAFVPSYYDQVRIPGYDGDLKTLSKGVLARIRWREARLHCPKCDGTPSLLPDYREWVQENLDDQHEAAGYYISPFDAPMLQSVGDLVFESTEYAKRTEFENQGLGITSVNSEEVLTMADLLRSRVEGSIADSGLYAMGADMGLICRIVIGRLDTTGALIVAHREKVPLALFEKRSRELALKYRCVIKVFDSMPYVDLIMRMQARDPNLWASVFVRSKKVEIFKVVEQDPEVEDGKLKVRQVSVNRNAAFDELVGHIKKIGMVFQGDPNEDEDFFSECLDMKRVQKRDENKELVYSWEKSARGEDHYFFALLYMYVAARLRGTATGVFNWPSLLMKVRLKSPV
jgi:hypothetical protein